VFENHCSTLKKQSLVPETVNIHSRSDICTMGEKEHFIPTSAAAQGVGEWVEALL